MNPKCSRLFFLSKTEVLETLILYQLLIKFSTMRLWKQLFETAPSIGFSDFDEIPDWLVNPAFCETIN